MERVDLAYEYGVDRQRAWRDDSSQSAFLTVVSFGRLANGRWYAQRRGWAADGDDRRLGACVFGADAKGKTLALRLAYSWMREGQWWPRPAAFDAGVPADGLPWVRRGGEWVLDRYRPASGAVGGGP